MTKLGCSLEEAFGETWKRQEHFTEIPVQNFNHVIKDPYGSFGTDEAFMPSEPNQFDINYGDWGAEIIGKLGNRLSVLESKLIDSQTGASKNTEKDNHHPIVEKGNVKEKFVGTLLQTLCEYVQTQEMENILLFVLITLFMANVFELFSKKI